MTKSKNPQVLKHLANLTNDSDEILGPLDSRAHCKINSTTRGENISVSVHEGADEALVTSVVDLALKGWEQALTGVVRAKQRIAALETPEKEEEEPLHE